MDSRRREETTGSRLLETGRKVTFCKKTVLDIRPGLMRY
jgi:hypothetical protein